MGKKAVVLSSGGLDSSTCLAVAIDTFGKENVSSVSVWYGQKHRKELESAKAIANYYGINNSTLDLSEIFKQSNCALLQGSTEDIPEGSYEEQQKNTTDGIVSTYVPFRNGLMLAAITSYAMGLYPDDEIYLYLGNHADDAAGNAYPDCSEKFSNLIAAAINEGTGKKVSVITPFVGLNKSQVVKKGLELGVPFELTWSCYAGGEVPCGKCGTCIDRAKAFALNGVEDPALKK